MSAHDVTSAPTQHMAEYKKSFGIGKVVNDLTGLYYS